MPTRLVAVSVAANTNPSTVANAAGDAVRNLYAAAARARADVDVVTIRLAVALASGGRCQVTATAQRVGAGTERPHG